MKSVCMCLCESTSSLYDNVRWKSYKYKCRVGSLVTRVWWKSVHAIKVVACPCERDEEQKAAMKRFHRSQTSCTVWKCLTTGGNVVWSFPSRETLGDFFLPADVQGSDIPQRQVEKQNASEVEKRKAEKERRYTQYDRQMDDASDWAGQTPGRGRTGHTWCTIPSGGAVSFFRVEHFRMAAARARSHGNTESAETGEHL